MVTKAQYEAALKVINDYAVQQANKRDIKSLQPHDIGCRVKLSAFGLEMQGAQLKSRRGTVIDFSAGQVNHLSDGTVLVKWDNVAEAQWMHISQTAKALK